MSIPIIFVWGHREVLSFRGWTAQTCVRCSRVQPFECYDLKRSDHVYFVYGEEREVGVVLFCDFCESSYGLSPGGGQASAIKTVRAWKRGDGLQALADETNPVLGVVPPRPPGEPRTEAEWLALLKSVNERSGVTKVDVMPGVWRGMFRGALCGVPVMLVLRLFARDFFPDAFGSGGLGLILGAALGAVYGGVTYQRSESRRIVWDMLLRAMERHGLSLSALKSAAARRPGEFPRVEAFVREMDEMDETDGDAAGAYADESDADAPAPAAPNPGAGPGGDASARRGRNVCGKCRLVNFASAETCKRCGEPLGGQTAA